jgi:hypothetical protein
MEAISAETLRWPLETLAAWTNPPQVHLAGGEAFIFFDLLLEGTRMAAELGLTVYAETGAAWCVDEAKARDRFATLQDAGLAAMLISCSPFHAEKVPPVRTMRAVRAALDVFGSQGVMVSRSEFLGIVEQFGLEQPTPLRGVGGLCGSRPAVMGRLWADLRRPDGIQAGAHGRAASGRGFQ